MPHDEQVTALLTLAADRAVDRAVGDAAALTAPPVSLFVARARRRRTTHRTVLATGAVVLAGLLVAVALAAPARRARRVSVGSSTVLGTATGDLLVFDDGYDGVATVDLDHRTVSRLEIPGQIAGDQPWRLTVSGSDLIVGWGQVYAAPLAGGPSVLLGSATMSLPAAEPGRVWLVSYSGGAIGEGTLSVRQVTTTGRTVIPATTPNPALGFGVPLVGIPGGLAFPTARGLALWDASTGRITETLGSPDPSFGFRAGLPSGDHLAWCDGACTVLHVTSLPHGDDVVSSFPGSSGFDVESARFSPDGRYLAVAARGGLIVVIDTATGATQMAAWNVSSVSSVAWGSDDSRLYFSSTAAGGLVGTVGLFDMDDGSTRTATIPAEVQSTFVVAPINEARWLLAPDLGPAVSCGAPAVQPSNRTGICGYRF